MLLGAWCCNAQTVTPRSYRNRQRAKQRETNPLYLPLRAGQFQQFWRGLPPNPYHRISWRGRASNGVFDASRPMFLEADTTIAGPPCAKQGRVFRCQPNHAGRLGCKPGPQPCLVAVRMGYAQPGPGAQPVGLNHRKKRRMGELSMEENEGMTMETMRLTRRRKNKHNMHNTHNKHNRPR